MECVEKRRHGQRECVPVVDHNFAPHLAFARGDASLVVLAFC